MKNIMMFGVALRAKYYRLVIMSGCMVISISLVIIMILANTEIRNNNISASSIHTVDSLEILSDITEPEIVELFEEYRASSTISDYNSQNYLIRVTNITNNDNSTSKAIVQYGDRYSDLYTATLSPYGSCITPGVDKSIFPIGVSVSSVVNSSLFENWEYKDELTAIKKLYNVSSTDLSVTNIILYNCCKVLFITNEVDGLQECYKVSRDTKIVEKLDINEQIKFLDTMITS